VDLDLGLTVHAEVVDLRLDLYFCRMLPLQAHRILRPTHDSSTDAYACDGHVYDAFAPH
jgi:hypothetical protein